MSGIPAWVGALIWLKSLEFTKTGCARLCGYPAWPARRSEYKQVEGRQHGRPVLWHTTWSLRDMAVPHPRAPERCHPCRRYGPG